MVVWIGVQVMVADSLQAPVFVKSRALEGRKFKAFLLGRPENYDSGQANGKDIA